MCDDQEGKSAFTCFLRVINRAVVLLALQSLTDDSLAISGSQVVITARCQKPSKPIGTRLVASLIDSEQNTAYIHFDSTIAGDPITKARRSPAQQPDEGYSRLRPNGTEQTEGRSCDISIFGKVKNPDYAGTPLSIILGHEAIHASHIFVGADITRSHDMEEACTIRYIAGISNDFTENQLRAELGIGGYR